MTTNLKFPTGGAKIREKKRIEVLTLLNSLINDTGKIKVLSTPVSETR